MLNPHVLHPFYLLHVISGSLHMLFVFLIVLVLSEINLVLLNLEIDLIAIIFLPFFELYLDFQLELNFLHPLFFLQFQILILIHFQYLSLKNYDFLLNHHVLWVPHPHH